MKLVAGRADVDDIDEFVDALSAIAIEHDCTVQAVDARYIAGRRHLSRALELADRAIERDSAIARDRSVEFLLYVAATRQIDRAFEIGISEGQFPVVVLVDATRPLEGDDSGGDAPAEAGDEAGAAAAVEELLDLAPLEKLICDSEQLREWFEITDDELAATDGDLETLVCERVALLALET